MYTLVPVYVYSLKCLTHPLLAVTVSTNSVKLARSVLNQGKISSEFHHLSWKFHDSFSQCR